MGFVCCEAVDASWPMSTSAKNNSSVVAAFTACYRVRDQISGSVVRKRSLNLVASMGWV
jgi:ribulose-5-phosphate 4-epimerase/fuculose-1-phosphate aldolase